MDTLALQKELPPLDPFLAVICSTAGKNAPPPATIPTLPWEWERETPTTPIYGLVFSILKPRWVTLFKNNKKASLLRKALIEK